MKVIYECEICGFKSENKKAVKRCEAQGNKREFLPQQEIKFLFAPRGVRRWVEGKIATTEFEQRTHRVIYGIISSDKNLPAQMRDVIIGGILEKDIQPIPF